ncbi:hypothetical protein GYMLUDRAFT_239350 [Collybiopsis luxurians FD-317 M1]|nr:hypothetical protein GYMLUDRAFT_239350 [Collybiopsis luxurians FD-317 M1]
MNIVNSTPAQADSSEELDSSQGEGPSHDKGKAVDPRNWGAAGLGYNKLNIEAQKKALDNFRAIRDAQAKKPVQNISHGNSDIEREIYQPQPKKLKAKKPKKRSNQCTGPEALTDQMDNHIHNLVEQHQQKPKVVSKCPNLGQSEHIT